jgi:hypothetical protein
MKVKLLRVGLLCFVLFPFARMYISGAPQIGTSSEIRGTNEDISAGSDPIVVAWSVAAILIFALLMVCLPRFAAEGAPRKWRRIASDLIDFVFSLTVLSAISALLPLWLESRRTGYFAWHFERHGAVNANSLFDFAGVFLLMFLMLCYFAVPLMLGKQSVGGCIMRIRMTSQFGADGRLTFRGALKRAGYEFLWVCLLVSGVFGGTHQDQARRDRVVHEAAAVLIADE